MSSLISSKFEGHKAPVLCLDYSSSQNHHDNGNGANNNLLLSGSEDRTARLWDVRDSKRRACLCIPVPGEVLSVQFAPQVPMPSKDDTTMQVDDDSSPSPVTTPFSKDHTMYGRKQGLDDILVWNVPTRLYLPIVPFLAFPFLAFLGFFLVVI